MDGWIHLMPSVLFFVIGAIAVASSILVVAMRNPVHSALFLLVTFLSVAALFIMQGAEFVGAVQILVYAGGIMVLFLFVVMLINVRTIRTERTFSPFWVGAIFVGAAVLLLLSVVVERGALHPAVGDPAMLRTAMVQETVFVTTPEGAVVQRQEERPRVVGNSEAVGMELYRKYLVPFEVASVFLLVAMIGAIVIGKRELSAEEEEAIPEYIRKRVADEKRIKEALGA
ncbi:MAG: NADH-quinone oxidoreductase subunit J [Thermoanaerobaculia bacterium]